MAASSVSAPARIEVLCLYRSLLRVAGQFCDYNIREYTKRRAIDAFRHNQTLTDPSKVSAAFTDGKAQLQVAKRQALMYSLYSPKIKSVMDIKPKVSKKEKHSLLIYQRANVPRNPCASWRAPSSNPKQSNSKITKLSFFCIARSIPIVNPAASTHTALLASISPLQPLIKPPLTTTP